MAFHVKVSNIIPSQHPNNNQQEPTRINMMKIISIILAVSCLASQVSTAPLNVHEHKHAFIKRDGSLPDTGVLNYALTLEHLEAAFYTKGLAQFSEHDFNGAGLASGTYQIFEEIRNHEQTHVQVLSSILGAAAVPACEYDFKYTDISGFLAVSRALENTGVAAYDGAAATIVEKAYLTAAATIVTVEARHASFLNYITNHPPIPQAFDTPLTPKQIVTIAGAFITSCPYDLGVVPYPALTLVANTDAAGWQVTASYTANDGAPTDGLYCLFLYGATTAHTALVNGSCYIPKDAEGDLYVFITSDSNAPSDANTIAGPAIFTVTN